MTKPIKELKTIVLKVLKKVLKRLLVSFVLVMFFMLLVKVIPLGTKLAESILLEFGEKGLLILIVLTVLPVIVLFYILVKEELKNEELKNDAKGIISKEKKIEADKAKVVINKDKY